MGILGSIVMKVDKIEVKSGTSENSEYAIVEFGANAAIRILAEKAIVDGSDNLTFYRDNESIAHVKVKGVPLEVPNMVRRAIKFGEFSSWE